MADPRRLNMPLPDDRVDATAVWNFSPASATWPNWRKASLLLTRMPFAK